MLEILHLWPKDTPQKLTVQNMKTRTRYTDMNEVSSSYGRCCDAKSTKHISFEYATQKPTKNVTKTVTNPIKCNNPAKMYNPRKVHKKSPKIATKNSTENPPKIHEKFCQKHPKNVSQNSQRNTKKIPNKSSINPPKNPPNNSPRKSSSKIFQKFL